LAHAHAERAGAKQRLSAFTGPDNLILFQVRNIGASGDAAIAGQHEIPRPRSYTIDKERHVEYGTGLGAKHG
jgi:hypothetical protein